MRSECCWIRRQRRQSNCWNPGRAPFSHPKSTLFPLERSTPSRIRKAGDNRNAHLRMGVAKGKVSLLVHVVHYYGDFDLPIPFGIGLAQLVLGITDLGVWPCRSSRFRSSGSRHCGALIDPCEKMKGLSCSTSRSYARKSPSRIRSVDLTDSVVARSVLRDGKDRAVGCG